MCFHKKCRILQVGLRLGYENRFARLATTVLVSGGLGLAGLGLGAEGIALADDRYGPH